MWSNEFLDSGIYLKSMETHKGYTWILGSNWTSPVVCCDGFSWNFVTSNKLILRFRYMKIHIFALRWKDEIRRSSQLRTLLKLVVVSRTWKKISGLKFFFHFHISKSSLRFVVVTSEHILMITLVKAFWINGILLAINDFSRMLLFRTCTASTSITT